MSTKRAHTLTEILIVTVISVIFFISVLGVFVVAKNLYARVIAAQGLQRDVNLALSTIVKGITENNNKSGLRSAVSFTIPSITEIDFVGSDTVARKYYLGPGGIVYNSPKQAPNPQTIYSTPVNGTITLRFWRPYMDYETVGIYIAIAQNVAGRNIYGSLSTYVNLRNTPK